MSVYASLAERLNIYIYTIFRKSSCFIYKSFVFCYYLMQEVIFLVKHIILWKLKAESNTLEVKKNIKENLENLMGKIDGLVEIKVQIECLPSSNADVMLYSVFENEHALKGYAVHPEHVFVADTFVRPFTEVRSCIDFQA